MKIEINREAIQKIQCWTKFATGEVSGLGLVCAVDNGLVVYDVRLIEQECTGASTELDDKGTVKLIKELGTEGADLADLRFWWHSHGAMSVFWSGTDTGTINELVKPGWIVSMVVNKGGEYLLRVDINIPPDRIKPYLLDMSTKSGEIQLSSNIYSLSFDRNLLANLIPNFPVINGTGAISVEAICVYLLKFFPFDSSSGLIKSLIEFL